jgi:hypothetical protein
MVATYRRLIAEAMTQSPSQVVSFISLLFSSRSLITTQEGVLGPRALSDPVLVLFPTLLSDPAASSLLQTLWQREHEAAGANFTSRSVEVFKDLVIKVWQATSSRSAEDIKRKLYGTKWLLQRWKCDYHYVSDTPQDLEERLRFIRKALELMDPKLPLPNRAEARGAQFTPPVPREALVHTPFSMREVSFSSSLL